MTNLPHFAGLRDGALVSLKKPASKKLVHLSIGAGAFGLAVISGFAAAFSWMSITVYTLMRKYDLLPKDDVDYHKKPPMMPMVPKV